MPGSLLFLQSLFFFPLFNLYISSSLFLKYHVKTEKISKAECNDLKNGLTGHIMGNGPKCQFIARLLETLNSYLLLSAQKERNCSQVYKL